MHTIGRRIESLVKAGKALGEQLEALKNKRETPLEEIIRKAGNTNGWFTEEAVVQALENVLPWLEQASIEDFMGHYTLRGATARNVGVVMAGNIPMVNFHDFISVWLSGHRFTGKISSQDPHLLPWFASLMVQDYPEASAYIQFTDQRLEKPEAIIATGSNNSARYFEYYFGKYPHIIRKNRTSVAILDGNETREELQELGKDVFTFYGLGCRNVGKLFLPESDAPGRVLEAWESFAPVGDHHKYRNNYDYHKAIFLVNRDTFFDNGFVMLKESDLLHAPVSVVFMERYTSRDQLLDRLNAQKEEIQCIVSRNGDLKFGKTQQPGLRDYPDGVDIMEFLLNL